MLDLSKVSDKKPEEAWELVKKADAERELDDFRDVGLHGADFAVRQVELTDIHIQAIKVYTKAVPATTYAQLEKSFRINKMRYHLIALVWSFQACIPKLWESLMGVLHDRRKRQETLGPLSISRVSSIARIPLATMKTLSRDDK